MASIPAPELDLSWTSDVEKYVESTPFASTEVVSLSGGSANFVFRLRLKAPFRGKPTAVLKHSKPYLKFNEDVGFDPRRQMYEVEALRRVREWLPADSIVQVPEVYHFDDQSYAIVMEDAGEGFLSLKEFMQVPIDEGGPTVEMAKEIGTALGKFLGELHAWGKKDEAMMALARKQEEAKKLIAWYYYDHLQEELRAQPKLLDPPLDITPEDWEAIGKLTSEASGIVQTTNDTFVMGDFWPGNMRVILEDGQLSKILVHDWEVVRAGQPGLELGQICAEIHLLGRCIPVAEQTAPVLLSHLQEAYGAAYGPSESDLRWCGVHWGVHMMKLGEIWGEKEIVRSVVEEGISRAVTAFGTPTHVGFL